MNKTKNWLAQIEHNMIELSKISISVFNGIGGVILVCLPRLREILDVNSVLVKSKIIKLVFAAFLLSIQYKEVRPMPGWLSFMIMCMS